MRKAAGIVVQLLAAWLIIALLIPQANPVVWLLAWSMNDARLQLWATATDPIAVIEKAPTLLRSGHCSGAVRHIDATAASGIESSTAG